MAIKRKIEKLESTKSIDEYASEIQSIGIEILPITATYLEFYEQIPLNNEHRDPFDGLFIATAFLENLAIITDDAKFKWYSTFIKVIW